MVLPVRQALNHPKQSAYHLYFFPSAVQYLHKYPTDRVNRREIMTPLRFSRARLAEPRAIPVLLQIVTFSAWAIELVTNGASVLPRR
jgi:hypothetical protein